MSAIDPRLAAALADRYTLEGTLGEGGMATVYLARDTKHNRHVAVKVLKPELAAVLGADRFLQEIELTANLQHPRILPLYDSGRAGDGDLHALYYVMPVADGESLRARLEREGQLGLADVVEITKAVATALDYAHGRGVIHRDIKPENILLQHGEPVVADFGIALALTESGGERLTSTGLSVGSPSYMSPEQVSGERTIDHRSDVYALGCVVYEMLVGEPPFTGRNVRAVMARQVTDQAPSITTVRPDTPAHVVAAVSKALAKVPGDRFDTAGALASAIADPGTPAHERRASSEPVSVVVLPFTNLSPDPDNEYVADGFTEEAISDLSAIGSLTVISRTSAMRLKGADRDARSIAADLGVRYVLEGSVRVSGGALRVTVRLVDAVTDAQVWTDRYTGTTTDVFAIQERVARGIVDALRVRLTPDEDRALGARAVTDPRASESYLRARALIWDFTVDSLDRARRHLEHALDLVGDNELLLATLGRVLVFYTNAGATADFAGADRCVRRIIALDPDSIHGVWLRGIVAFQRGDLRAARPDLERAHQAMPDDPDVLLMLGYLLSLSGQLDRAETLYRRAIEVDPLTPVNHAMPGFNALLDGRLPDAVAPYAAFRDMDPRHPMGVWAYGWALLYNRRIDEAEAILARAAAGMPDNAFVTLLRAQVLGAQGRRDEAAAAISSELLELGATNELFARELTHCYALAGRADDAIRWFEHTVEIGSINYPFWAHHDWMVDSVRGDDRFQALLQRVWDEWAQGVPPDVTARYPRPSIGDAVEVPPERAPPPAPTIAVLPFLNRSPDPDTAFFADGVTDDIIAQLSKLRELRVISRRSTERYRESDKRTADIAAELGATAILEGTIRRAADRVRVVAELIDAANDRNLWSETYDRDLTDVFEIQTDIAGNIARALEMNLTQGDRRRLSARPTDDLRAYDLFLLGQHHVTKRTDDGIRRGIEYFDQALARDPAFTRALAARAEAYLFAGLGYARMHYREALARAVADARAAIAMDDTLAEAHATHGIAVLMQDWDVAGARASVDRALALNPSVPSGHQWMAWCRLFDGDLAVAFDEWERALALDPMSAVVLTESGWPFGYVGLYEAARHRFLRALEIEPDLALARYNVGWTYDGEGRMAEAIAWYRQAAEASGGIPWMKAFLAGALWRSGAREEALAIRDELVASREVGEADSLSIAFVEDAMGNVDAALDALEGAYRDRIPFVVGLANAGWLPFTRIRPHPRFQRLLDRLDMPVVHLAAERAKLEQRLQAS